VETDPAVWISELRASQQRQAELVGQLTPEELRRPSYDRDWTVAQLLSHMGSGGEITSRRLAGALAGAPPFQWEDAEKVWARWNAMPPEQQAAEMLEYDRACVEDFERLDERARRELRITYGEDTVVDVAGAAALRLNEHALHSWDTTALLRLCYGRLDPAHTPAGVQVEPPLTLDDLRATFNGY
jgi:hypothetical protein